MLSENVISEKNFSDHTRSGFLVPDQKSRFLISFFKSIRSGLYTGFYGDKSCSKILILPKIFPTRFCFTFMRTKSCTKILRDFQMAGNVLSWQKLSPKFSNGGCHEILMRRDKSIAPLLSLGDRQKTLETQKHTR